MKASALIGPKHSEIIDVPMPVCGRGDVLVKVEACGVCYSEMHDWENGITGSRYPKIMGHEPSGKVVEIGDQVKSISKGQNVTVLPTHRGTYTDYYGSGFAEYIVVPEERAVVLPEGLSFDEALGEPIGCLVSALKRSEILPPDRVAIVGCGYMGLLTLQLIAMKKPKQIIAIDLRKESLCNAARLGADVTFFPDEVPQEDKLVSWSDLGKGIDVVFEVTGTQGGLTLAGDLVKAHGALSILGYHQGGNRTVNMGLWNWKAITVINGQERRNDYLVQAMAEGMDLVSKKKIDMASLVTHSFSLIDVDAAFNAMGEKPLGFIKGVIHPKS